MRYVLMLAAVMLAGCGGGDGSTVSQPPQSAASVVLETSDFDCVSAHNADHVIDYVAGPQPARTLLWACPSHDGSAGALRVFLGFDYGLQCYTELARARETACTSEVAPQQAEFGMEIAEFNAEFAYANGQTGTLSFDITAANTGNVAAFGATYAVRPVSPAYDEYANKIGYHSGRTEDIHYLKTPEEEAKTPWNNWYSHGFISTPFPVYQGDQFSYIIELRDGFGRVADSMYHHVYAH